MPPDTPTTMDGALIDAIARECLGIALTEREAAALVQPYLALRAAMRTLDQVALPFTCDPFISPATADEWLKRWPDK